MSKHTPGPWRIVKNNNGTINIVGANDAEGFALKVALINNADEDNARVIVAAPELLDELKRLVRWHDQLSAKDIAKAEAVIAKAEGRS